MAGNREDSILENLNRLSARLDDLDARMKTILASFKRLSNHSNEERFAVPTAARHGGQQAWFNVTQASTYLGKNRKYIEQLMRNGMIQAYLPAGSKRRVYKREDLDHLMVRVR